MEGTAGGQCEAADAQALSSEPAGEPSTYIPENIPLLSTLGK